MLFEGLTRTSKTGETELALAKAVDISPDGRTYAFHLRNASWSDGSPLTAFDFADTWRTLLSPQFASDIAYNLYAIKNGQKAKLGEVDVAKVGISTPDAQTLVVELENPLPYFLELVSQTVFFPTPSQITSSDPNWCLEAASFVGNGPFRLKEWKHSDQLTLTKNPLYWNADEVKMESVELVMAAPDTGLRMFEEKKLDWAGSPLSIIPPDAIQHLKETEQLQISPFLATYFFRVNTEALVGGKPNPLSNPKIRRALSRAIDREAITQHILQGGHTPAFSLVPPQMGLSSSGSLKQSPKEDFSKEELIEPIAITYANTERSATLAQAVQKQWESALGIRVVLDAVETKVFYQKIAKKDYQLAAGNWTADFNDPINFLEVFKFKDGTTNNTGWESPEYVDLLNRSQVSTNSEMRKHMLSKAEEILMNELPILPVFHFALNYLKESHLKGMVLSPVGQLDVRWAHFEETR